MASYRWKHLRAQKQVHFMSFSLVFCCCLLSLSGEISSVIECMELGVSDLQAPRIDYHIDNRRVQTLGLSWCKCTWRAAHSYFLQFQGHYTQCILLKRMDSVLNEAGEMQSWRQTHWSVPHLTLVNLTQQGQNQNANEVNRCLTGHACNGHSVWITRPYACA